MKSSYYYEIKILKMYNQKKYAMHHKTEEIEQKKTVTQSFCHHSTLSHISCKSVVSRHESLQMY